MKVKNYQAVIEKKINMENFSNRITLTDDDTHVIINIFNIYTIYAYIFYLCLFTYILIINLFFLENKNF